MPETLTATHTPGAGAPHDTAAGRPARGRRVTDAPMRFFHALFALCFVGAWLTADSEHWRVLHVTLGYTFGGLLAFRLLYGWLGPRPARLATLWRRVAGWPAWLRSMRGAGGAAARPWRQGQNLLMAGVLVALLAAAAPLVLSGWMTYEGWGGHALEEVHESVANVFLVLVLLHLSMLALLSVLRGRNLARPMLSGCLREPGPDLVGADRRGLAALLLVAVLAFWTWQWQSSAGDGLAADGRPLGDAAERVPAAPGTADDGRHGDGRHRDERHDDDD